MVKYECLRCGYNTKSKSSFMNHLNRKNICIPVKDNIGIEEIKKFYGFDTNIKCNTQNEPQMTQNEPHMTQYEPQNEPQMTPKSTIAQNCIYCNKSYSKMCHLRRHEKTCKKKKEAETLVIKQNEQFQKMEKEIEGFIEKYLEEDKKLIFDLIEKTESLLNNE